MITLEELKRRLTYEYSSGILSESRERRLFNIDSFIGIDRERLRYNETERRLYLYNTCKGEKIYIQFPGKESIEEPPMEYDFRPRVMLRDGSIMNDFTFGQIWDVFEYVGEKYNDALSFIAAIVYDLGYLQGYKLSAGVYNYEDVSVTGESEKVVDSGSIKFEWYELGIDDETWESLNDRIDDIPLENDKVVSIEAILKMLDLLFQNEDCKYYYKKALIHREEQYRQVLNNGRPNTSHSNLFMLNYLQGNEKVSSLVNSFVKGRGVANFKKSDYSIVTNGLVLNSEGNQYS